jgi:hypothetical protein
VDTGFPTIGMQENTGLGTLGANHNVPNSKNFLASASKFVRTLSPCGVLRVDDETQRRYDVETEFGVNLARQREWDANTARQLNALKSYAR